jgi:hypothetical protein
MPADLSRAQARKYGTALLVELRQSLGPDWDDAWLRKRYKTVDRTELRVLMNLDLALIGRDKLATEAAGKALEEGDAPPELTAIWELLEAHTWAEAARLVQAHPEMLASDRVALLAEMADRTEQELDDISARVLRQHQRFLEQCLAVGVEAALEAYQGAPKREAGT